MKIAVFGGSFNPLHNGHAMLADTIIKEFAYDKVLFVPTFMPPHKIINVKVSPELRLKMLKAFCEENGDGHFELEPCEIERGGLSYTVDTLEYLTEKYKGKIEGKLAFVMGDEVAAEFDKWNKPERVSELADLIITHRSKADYSVVDKSSDAAMIKNTPTGSYKGDFKVAFNKASFKYPFKYVTEPILPVSSSDIRKRIMDGKSFRYLVPEVIYRFILEYGLYGKK